MLDGCMYSNFDDIKAFAFAVFITFFTLMKGLHFFYMEHDDDMEY